MKMPIATSRREFLRAGVGLAAGLALGSPAIAGRAKRRVVVWSERTAPPWVYPKDVNNAIADGLRTMRDWDVVVASIDDPEQGLPASLLESTSVLIWWGHKRHDQVKTELVDQIVSRVTEGKMGFIATHSAHYSRPLKALLKTPCGWSDYVNDGASVKIVLTAPKHPIAKGIQEFTIPKTERYSDPFQVPTPEAVIFNGIYGRHDHVPEQAQQGMVWTVGKGRVFYFQPGHEEYPIYFMPEIRAIFRNGVEWCSHKAR
jgi:trehalose utilization protein